jgi:hypothetical protein
MKGNERTNNFQSLERAKKIHKQQNREEKKTHHATVKKKNKSFTHIIRTGLLYKCGKQAEK